MENYQFNFESFIAALMDEMEMDKASEEVQKRVTWELGRQLGHRLITSLSLNMSKEEWEALLKDDKSKDINEGVQKIIEGNEELKNKLVEELDDFYNETLAAFRSFSNK